MFWCPDDGLAKFFYWFYCADDGHMLLFSLHHYIVDSELTGNYNIIEIKIPI